MHLVVSDFGVFVGKKSERLTISSKGKIIQEVPLRDLEQVTIASRGVTVSTDALASCIEFGIPMNFLTTTGKPYALITSPELNGTVQTRREQLKAYDDKRGVYLARCFVKGKIGNQASLIKYFAKHRTGTESYEKMMDAASEMEKLEKEADEIDGDHVDQVRPYLMNLEGRAASLYWDIVGPLAAGDDFKGREHRGATDPFNASLNYGYGILYTQVWGALVLAGLEPFGGFLHVDRPGKPSLVLDMVEEFRAPVVDRSVIVTFIKGWRPDFDEDNALTQESRRHIAGIVLERLELRDRYSGKKQKLEGIILAQARRLASYLRGEGQYKPYSATW